VVQVAAVVEVPAVPAVHPLLREPHELRQAPLFNQYPVRQVAHVPATLCEAQFA